MPSLTRPSWKTLQERIKREPAFGAELLNVMFECLLEGEVGTGRAMLQEYIDATIGFQKLGKLISKSPDSLMQMFTSEESLDAHTLFAVIHCLQQQAGLQLKVKAVAKPSQPTQQAALSH